MGWDEGLDHGEGDEGFRRTPVSWLSLGCLGTSHLSKIPFSSPKSSRWRPQRPHCHLTLPSSQAPPPENPAACGDVAARPAPARQRLLRRQPRFGQEPLAPAAQPEPRPPRSTPVPAAQGEEEEQEPVPFIPWGPAAPQHRFGGLRGSLFGYFGFVLFCFVFSGESSYRLYIF